MYVCMYVCLGMRCIRLIPILFVATHYSMLLTLAISIFLLSLPPSVGLPTEAAVYCDPRPHEAHGG